jgi:hypothetical protein
MSILFKGEAMAVVLSTEEQIPYEEFVYRNS